MPYKAGNAFSQQKEISRLRRLKDQEAEVAMEHTGEKAVPTQAKYPEHTTDDPRREVDTTPDIPDTPHTTWSGITGPVEFPKAETEDEEPQPIPVVDHTRTSKERNNTVKKALLTSITAPVSTTPKPSFIGAPHGHEQLSRPSKLNQWTSKLKKNKRKPIQDPVTGRDINQPRRNHSSRRGAYYGPSCSFPSFPPKQVSGATYQHMSSNTNHGQVSNSGNINIYAPTAPGYGYGPPHNLPSLVTHTSPTQTQIPNYSHPYSQYGGQMTDHGYNAAYNFSQTPIAMRNFSGASYDSQASQYSPAWAYPNTYWNNTVAPQVLQVQTPSIARFPDPHYSSLTQQTYATDPDHYATAVPGNEGMILSTDSMAPTRSGGYATYGKPQLVEHRPHLSMTAQLAGPLVVGPQRDGEDASSDDSSIDVIPELKDREAAETTSMLSPVSRAFTPTAGTGVVGRTEFDEMVRRVGALELALARIEDKIA